MPSSPLPTFMQLDRAATLAQARRALEVFPGPPQNFVLADRTGVVAYHLAGLVPKDPSWAMRVHESTDPLYPFVPYDRLPAVAPSRDGVLFTANNRMYGLGYPLRLSASFAPPYRAKRIEQLLNGRQISLTALTKLQSDTLSIPERDLARATIDAAVRKRVANDADLQPYLRELQQWDGRFDPASHGAAIAWELRRVAVTSLDNYATGRYAGMYSKSAGNADLVLLLRVLRERPRGWWPGSDYDDLLVRSLRAAISRHGTSMLQPWGAYAQATVKHPLSAMGASFLNGAVFPGEGDSFGLHVQTADHSQSFRAVWDVGNWDAGGLVIPSGESGEPRSGHYTDQSANWIRGQLHPLPFSDSAIQAAARSTLTMRPR
jgi:penicillin amidase